MNISTHEHTSVGLYLKNKLLPKSGMCITVFFDSILLDCIKIKNIYPKFKYSCFFFDTFRGKRSKYTVLWRIAVESLSLRKI